MSAITHRKRSFDTYRSYNQGIDDAVLLMTSVVFKKLRGLQHVHATVISRDRFLDYGMGNRLNYKSMKKFIEGGLTRLRSLSEENHKKKYQTQHAAGEFKIVTKHSNFENGEKLEPLEESSIFMTDCYELLK